MDVYTTVLIISEHYITAYMYVFMYLANEIAVNTYYTQGKLMCQNYTIVCAIWLIGVLFSQLLIYVCCLVC